MLFVYGTLRRGSVHPLAQALTRRARYLGVARAAGRLYDLGPYPGMTEPLLAGEWVHGDLYALDEVEPLWAELDGYEGCGPGQPRPALFERRQADVVCASEESLQAWVYYYCGPTAKGQRILSGDYHQAPGRVFEPRGSDPAGS